MLFLIFTLIPLIICWKIVPNQDRITSIEGVLCPKYTVQLDENEILNDFDKNEIFNTWGELTASGRNSIEEIKKDTCCYPGPLMNRSQGLLTCDQLRQAENETIKEAIDFFQELTDSNESLTAAAKPILSEFSRHWSLVNRLNEALPMAKGNFKIQLNKAMELGMNILNQRSPPTIAIINKNNSLNQIIHETPIVFRKSCRWNLTDKDEAIKNAGPLIGPDWIQKLLQGNETINENTEADAPCENATDFRQKVRGIICSRQFWKINFTNTPIFNQFKIIESVSGPVFEKFIRYVQNLSMTDEHFTSQCQQLLNNTYLEKVVDGLMRNLSSFKPKQKNLSGELSTFVSKILPTIKDVLLTKQNSSSNQLNQNTVKKSILNSIGPQLPQVNEVLSKFVG